VGDKLNKDGRHAPLFELATHQYGVVSTRQLAALGYTRSSASKANGVGRLRRLHRGVYAVGHRRLSWESHCMAAVLAAAPLPAAAGHAPVVASHLSAAWLWDVLRYRPEAIHVTVPARRHTKRSFVVHDARLAAVDRGVREGIPVTSLPRTLLDLATILRPEPLASVLQQAEERKLLDLRPLDELLERVPHHSGAAPLRRALDIYRPQTSFTRSGLEKRFLALVLTAGLPRPRTNFVVGSHELDAYWPERRFAVELDVYETHGSRRFFEEDRIRQEDLLLAGIASTRITGPRLDREPEAVLARLARLLAERAPASASLN
jgi:predicted transcriptional regulator of viral defense system